MSKMTCMEAIAESLFGPVTAGMDDPIFEDMVNGCMAVAIGECEETDVVSWIVSHRKERSEIEVCLEILKFFRWHCRGRKPSEVLAAAVAAGKAAL